MELDNLKNFSKKIWLYPIIIRSPFNFGCTQIVYLIFFVAINKYNRVQKLHPTNLNKF